MAIYLVSRIGMWLVSGAAAVAQHLPFTKTFVVWDSKWYLMIAQSGYVHSIPPGSGNPAQCDLGFFPLLPILIRTVHVVSPFGWNVTGLITTFLLGACASVAVWWMLHDVFGISGADRGNALVFFAPGAFAFSLVYSEGAIVLFVALSLLALGRHRWVLAGLAAALATAADPVGVAAIAPCFVAAYLAIRSRRDWRSLWAAGLSPLGVVAFFSYLWVHTGSPLEYFKAQRAGWQGGNLGASVPRAFEHVVQHGFADINYGVKVVSLFVAVGLLIVFFRARPPAPWIGYVVTVVAFGLISPLIGFTPRLLLRAFPLFGVVGAKLPKLWFKIVFGLSAMCFAACSILITTGHWTP